MEYGTFNIIHVSPCQHSKCCVVVDIDECTENGKICLNGECINTPGSHRCECNPGYQLSPDGAFCLGT